MGVLVNLTNEDGVSGTGDAAPLEAFGTGSLEDSLAALHRLRDLLPGLSTSDVPGILSSPEFQTSTPAPVRLALDIARLEIESKNAGRSLGAYLGALDRRSVPVNATIGASTPRETIRLAREAVQSGFTSLKLKVGAGRNLEAEIERVAAVRQEIGPDVELRLDGNGAYALREARRLCDRLTEFDVAYIEQPLPSDQIAEMADVRANTSVPIAADEAATSLAEIDAVLRAGAADLLILKPGAIGAIADFQTALDMAVDFEVRVVVTSLMDSGVGVASALQLATLLPEPIPACGLATLDLLEDDLLEPGLRVVDGEMLLPDMPGLGVTIDMTSKYLQRVPQ